MAEYGFSTEEKGYSIPEVDRYIQRLQAEYKNAVEWSNEIERKAEESEKGISSGEIETLRRENEKLTSDCRLLAARLRELMQNEEQSESSKEDAQRILAEAQKSAEEIIRGAEEKAAETLRSAESRANEITAAAAAAAAEATGSAENRAAVIIEKAERECQGIILDAEGKIEGVKEELRTLHEEKNEISSEIKKLLVMKDDISERMARVKELLDI